MSSGNSRQVHSNQTESFAALERLWARREGRFWQQPIAWHTRKVFERFAPSMVEASRVVLDSGCGKGESTERLTEHFPESLVLGMDRSQSRLEMMAGESARQLTDNAWLLRVELADFWRLFEAAGLVADAHYILYPNPYPKARHLARRWHAHPVFETLLAISNTIELRSNWRRYLDEFALGLERFGYGESRLLELQPEDLEDPMTPFERKYAGSGHALWQLQACRSD